MRRRCSKAHWTPEGQMHMNKIKMTGAQCTDVDQILQTKHVEIHA